MSVTSLEIGKKVCEALGIKSDGVVSISINITAGELVYVNITKTAKIEEIEGLCHILKEYTLEQTDKTPEIVVYD